MITTQFFFNFIISLKKNIKTKHFFMEIIIYTFKQSVAKIFPRHDRLRQLQNINCLEIQKNNKMS